MSFHYRGNFISDCIVPANAGVAKLLTKNSKIMFKVEVIGNLGGNAEIKTENGRQFVSLSIAHTDVRTDGNGTRHENTTWVSATINGDGGKLLQYLVKGAKVRAYGDGQLRVYHSEKQRCLVAGLNLYVRDIDLLPGSTDEVPRQLFDGDGVAHDVKKFYWADVKGVLMSQQGKRYVADKKGFITPEINPTEQTQG